jgi:hypothetical protein
MIGKAGASAVSRYLTFYADALNASGLNPQERAAKQAFYHSSQLELNRVKSNHGMVETFDVTLRLNIKQLENLMAKMPPQEGTTFESYLAQAAKLKLLGDQSVASYLTLVQSIREEYGKVMAGSTGAAGLTATQQKAVEPLVNPNYTTEQLRAVLNTIATETTNRLESFRTVEEDIVQMISTDGKHGSLDPTRLPPAVKSAFDSNALQPGGTLRFYDKDANRTYTILKDDAGMPRVVGLFPGRLPPEDNRRDGDSGK